MLSYLYVICVTRINLDKHIYIYMYVYIYVMHQQDRLLLRQLRLTFPPVWTEQGTE